VSAAQLDLEDRWFDRALGGRWGVVCAALAGWTILAAIPTTSAFIAAGGEDTALWWRIFRPIVLYYYGWALLTPLIYVMVTRLPLSGGRGVLTILAHLAVLVGFSVAATVVHGHAWRDWVYGPYAPGYHTMSVFSYGFALLVCLAVRSHRLALAREREAAEMRLRSARLDSQLSEARIDALRMQVNPHFLFNALNSIAALIESSRNTEAYRTTELLGQMLRAALNESRQVDVPLEEELRFIENYLALEQIRFGDRLRFASRVDRQALEHAVPAMLLQPLVENAVKHGVAPCERTVTVALGARIEGESLVIEIDDDGPGFDPGPPQGATAPGHGLRNVRDRLRLRFPVGASLDIGSRAEGGTRVCLRMPALR
jgi:two-component system, LytTR family, sensor kinase